MGSRMANRPSEHGSRGVSLGATHQVGGFRLGGHRRPCEAPGALCSGGSHGCGAGDPPEGVGSLWYAPPELNPPVSGAEIVMDEVHGGKSDMWRPERL